MLPEDNDLKRILSAADQAPPPIAGQPRDFSQRVHAAAKRRRRRSHLAAASAVAVAGLALWLGTKNLEPNPSRSIAGKPSVDGPTSTEAATQNMRVTSNVTQDNLSQQIAEKERLIAALLAGERKRELTIRLMQIPDTLSDIPRQREEAAGIGYWYAQSLEQTNKGLARKQYEHVIKLYPNSLVSVAAANQLNQIPE